MVDRYGRLIDYLRISVTERCNFRCSYCMPRQGVSLLEQQEILSYEEILRIIRVLGQYGINKIRITGGEPLVRTGIVDFIKNIKKIPTVTDLSMTTNGSLLAEEGMAQKLKEAGLDRINISLDTADSIRFASITGQNSLAQVLAGVESALTAKFSSVKLNVVLMAELSQQDIVYFINQIHHHPIAIRFIEYMPIGPQSFQQGTSVKGVKQMIEEAAQGTLQSTVVINSNGPARYYRLPGAQGVFGFITPMSDHFCHACNRIRLTADGKIKSCLLSNQEFDIKSLLRSGCDDFSVYELFAQALAGKSLQHQATYRQEKNAVTRPMSRVGG